MWIVERFICCVEDTGADHALQEEKTCSVPRCDGGDV